MSHLKAVLSTYLSSRLSLSNLVFSPYLDTNCAGILGQEFKVSVSLLSSDMIKKKAFQPDMTESHLANTHWYQNTSHVYIVPHNYLSVT